MESVRRRGLETLLEVDSRQTQEEFQLTLEVTTNNFKSFEMKEIGLHMN